MRRGRLSGIVGIGLVTFVVALVLFVRQEARDQRTDVDGRGDVGVAPAVPSEGADRPQAASRSRRVLFGEVVTVDGVGISGASVSLLRADEAQRTITVSDPHGQFTIDDVDDVVRRYRGQGAHLRFTAPGFLPADIDVDTLPDTDEAFWSQPLKADPEALFLTVVEAETGAPIADASVFTVVLGDAPAQGSPKVRLQRLGETDQSGRAPLPAGAHDVVVAHAGHGVEQHRAEVTTSLTLTLPVGGHLVVRVVDGDGPVKGAPVRFTPEEGRGDAVKPRFVDDVVERQAYYSSVRRLGPHATDDDGTVDVPVPRGSVGVDVVAQGHRPVHVQHDAQPTDDHGVGLTVTLDESPVVRGVVVDAVTDAPIAGARIDVDGGTQARTNTEGVFFLTTLPDRATSITVSARGYQRTIVGGVDGEVGSSGDGNPEDGLRVALTPGKGEQVVGIGVRVAPAPMGARVDAVEPNTPAEDAGLEPGDLIIAVDGEKLDGNLNNSMGRIRGAPDTEVRLSVQRRNGRVEDVRILRAAIRIR